MQHYSGSTGTQQHSAQKPRARLTGGHRLLDAKKLYLYF